MLVLSEDEMELLVVTAASKCRPGVAEGMSTVLERLLKISGTEVEVEGPARPVQMVRVQRAVKMRTVKIVIEVARWNSPNNFKINQVTLT